MKPQVTFSSYNQATLNGKKEYAIWLHRDNNTSKSLGVAYYSAGQWQALVDDGKGRQVHHSNRTLLGLKATVRGVVL